MTLNLFWFDCEFTLESVPGTNQYLSNKGKVSCSTKPRGWGGGFDGARTPRPPHYESDVQPTVPRHPLPIRHFDISFTESRSLYYFRFNH